MTAEPKPIKRRPMNKLQPAVVEAIQELWKPNHKQRAVVKHAFTDEHIQVCLN